MKNIQHLIIAFAAAMILNACSPAGGTFTGSEYMPDMAHSVAYEANTYNYYYYNTWDEASTFKLKQLAIARDPVKGTIPRGYAGIYLAPTSTAQNAMLDRLHGLDQINAISEPMNGHAPYYYADSEAGRARAIAEITDNPYPITAAGLEKGKELYTLYCAICHGDKGDGQGYLVNSDENPNVKYPLVPAIFTKDTFYLASNGRFYHTIMYGRNAMGSYADKLGYEERWEVIHYIRSLQAKAQKLEYDEEKNTFNPAFGTPGKQFQAMHAMMSTDMEMQPGEAHDGETPAEGEGTGHSQEGGNGHQ
ncbi:MAG: c-type cytochrome [Lewinellaceae bacterium]|nr:c-type cytochrome [Lewinella sp.]MCB9278852.1 c-type cytochrome [Lewinellaceae bacterium]